MSELFEAVEKRLQKDKDHDETVSLWRRVWDRYEQNGLDGVEELLDGLVVVPEDAE